MRLPRQPGGSSAIDKEWRWAPYVGRHLSVAVPEFIALGQPAYGYDEQWSIVRWLAGKLPNVCSESEASTEQRSVLAADLASTIKSLRVIDVPEAAAMDPSLRSYRGRSLTEFDAQFRRDVEQCRSIEDLDLDLDAALTVWETTKGLSGVSKMANACWHHSDLVAENLLLTEGRLTGVLDFGGLAIGDPTIDLHGAWELFDASARDVFRTQLEVSDLEWLRGRTWALAIALGSFAYYWDKIPGRRRNRLVMAQSVLADVENNGW